LHKEKDKQYKVVLTDTFAKSVERCFGGGWWAVVRFFKDVWCEITRFPEKFSRAFRWFRFMYNNEDWDTSVYFIPMIQKRLEELAKHHAKYGYHIHNKSYARLMRLAATYLKKVHEEDELDTPLYKLHQEKYGELDMKTIPSEDGKEVTCKFTRSKCKTEEEERHAAKVAIRISRRYWYNRQKYYKKAFNIIAKYMDSWWN